MEVTVFIISAVIILTGAGGVIFRDNPVHCALSLVQTLFGVAVLFIAQDAQFLAAVQIIVYAGAIVVLFLFVIMLLGVDRAESLKIEPLRTQRPIAAVVGVGTLGLTLLAFFVAGKREITGKVADNISPDEPNINQLARAIFGDNVLAFEVTSVLLVIAVIGTVLLARRPAKKLETEGDR